MDNHDESSQESDGGDSSSSNIDRGTLEGGDAGSSDMHEGSLDGGDSGSSGWTGLQSS
ncbi:unnamed protein product, partial [Callosobruchus maculatus]